MKWFKIYEDGLSGQTWAVDKLITNKGKVSFTIPSCIESGQYLLRHEIIGVFGRPFPGLYMSSALMYPQFAQPSTPRRVTLAHSSTWSARRSTSLAVARRALRLCPSLVPTRVPTPVCFLVLHYADSAIYICAFVGIKINIYQTLSNYTIPGALGYSH